MIVNCRCATSVEAKLSLDTDEVICQECGEIVEISSFMKGAMRSTGDVIRDTRPKIPMGGMLSVCQKCGKEFSAELDRKTKKCHCPKCKTEFKLSGMATDRLLEYKIFVGQSADLIKKDEDKDEDGVGDVAPASRAQIKTASYDDDDDNEEIKNVFGSSKIDKPKAVNKLKEKALKEKGLLQNKAIKRRNVDSNGDPIGGKVVFHPEAEESDAQLIADLEGRSGPETKSVRAPKAAKAAKSKAPKKVKNK